VTLTPDDLRMLRAPFTPTAVKFRPDAKQPDAQGRVRCVAHLDARLVAERLDHVDPLWTGDYQFIGASAGDPLGGAHHFPVRYSLTVKGVTRHDIGQQAGTGKDGKHLKTVVGDGFKRAAVMFGVGRYLYGKPGTYYVSKDEVWFKGDKVGGLKDSGVKSLRSQYLKLISHPLFVERFGEPVDYGDSADDIEEPAPLTDPHAEYLAKVAELADYGSAGAADLVSRVCEPDYASELERLATLIAGRSREADPLVVRDAILAGDLFQAQILLEGESDLPTNYEAPAQQSLGVAS
jgi:hypothetical protein